ncbi:MAG: hypothetical protein P8X94_01175 [Woeseiaceae bacterium]
MFFVVDPDMEVAPQQSALVWQRLWEMRDLTPIGAVMPAVVTSACPLLPDENADALLVASLTQVPSGSAWVSFEIDLTRYLQNDGELREQPLDAALRACVAAGERRHDETRWGDMAQLADSNNNRRLSVFVRGWGDVVALRRADPASMETLREIESLADRITAVLAGKSRSMAAEIGYCPALDIAGARVVCHGREMNARRRRAVMENGLRHRNLLTISPWDVFPRGAPADFRYMNLLPVIHKAHAVSMRRDADISCWHARDFKAFHERVSAILRSASDLPLVARQL